MKPISVATFLVSMLMLGTTLLWFPDIMGIVSNWFPVGTPTWLIDFIEILPFLMLSILLIIYVLKLSKRGKRQDFHEE